jgi:nucleotide-binding universal stress UspA family protein
MTDRTAYAGFARVVCGMDGTREGFESARQGARLLRPGGRLALVAVAEYYAALVGRWGPTGRGRGEAVPRGAGLDDLYERLHARARSSLEQAASQLDVAELSTVVIDGDADYRLRKAAEDEGADLLALGTHGTGRLVGTLVGETTARLLHEVPMSVLVARAPFDPGRFPASIVAGTDGSPESLAALRLAAGLAEGSGGRLIIVAAGSRARDAADALRGFDAPHELRVSPERAVDALVAEARWTDLLVVGSRGLGGAASLGSVSERVAHRADSSVLVVRRPGEGLG